MPPRLSMTKARRARILDRDDHACVLCGEDDRLEIDHEIGLFFHDIDPIRWPLSMLEEDDNLRTLCLRCHTAHSAVQARIRAKLNRITGITKPKAKRKWPKRQWQKRGLR